MKFYPSLATLCVPALPLSAAQEKAVNFIPAKADPLVGDWQGSGFVAQVFPTADGKYSANVSPKFDVPDDNPVAVLSGATAGDTIAFSGDGWSGVIAKGQFTASKGSEKFDLQHVIRTPPSLRARPPKGAVVLFDGHNLDAWAKGRIRTLPPERRTPFRQAVERG